MMARQSLALGARPHAPDRSRFPAFIQAPQSSPVSALDDLLVTYWKDHWVDDLSFPGEGLIAAYMTTLCSRF
ncbi:MAG: hypothetical protein AAFO01_21435 [Pseudomonadota bacterium]